MEFWAQVFIPDPRIAVATPGTVCRPHATSAHRPTFDDGWSRCRNPKGREPVMLASQVSVSWGVFSSGGDGAVRPASAWDHEPRLAKLRRWLGK